MSSKARRKHLADLKRHYAHLIEEANNVEMLKRGILPHSEQLHRRMIGAKPAVWKMGRRFGIDYERVDSKPDEHLAANVAATRGSSDVSKARRQRLYDKERKNYRKSSYYQRQNFLALLPLDLVCPLCKRYVPASRAWVASRRVPYTNFFVDPTKVGTRSIPLKFAVCRSCYLTPNMADQIQTISPDDVYDLDRYKRAREQAQQRDKLTTTRVPEPPPGAVSPKPKKARWSTKHRNASLPADRVCPTCLRTYHKPNQWVVRNKAGWLKRAVCLACYRQEKR